MDVSAKDHKASEYMPMRKIDKVYIHCSDSVWGNHGAITEWHKQRGLTNAAGEMGYHYLILNGLLTAEDAKRGDYKADMDGMIVEGRKVETAGAHVAGDNKNSIGICLVGKYAFTEKQVEALIDLCREIIGVYDLDPDDFWGHREYWEMNGGAAPKTCPNFKVESIRKVLRQRLEDIA